MKVWHQVEADQLPLRLDRMVVEAFERFPTRASARKAIKRGEVLLNGEAAESSRFMKEGDIVEILASRRHVPKLDLELKVWHEDDHVAVVDKPGGMETSGSKFYVLEHALPGNLTPSTQPDALPAPRVAHRLDYGTSGLVVCGKTASAHAALGRSFQAREVFKRYRAIVAGRLEEDVSVDQPLDGREARSRVVVLEHTRSLHIGWETTVDLLPETGRTHQLRRHLAGLGHPVLGDRQYTEGKVLHGQGLFLCAVELRLAHPFGGELHVVREEPARFKSFRAREERRFKRWEEASSQPA